MRLIGKKPGRFPPILYSWRTIYYGAMNVFCLWIQGRNMWRFRGAHDTFENVLLGLNCFAFTCTLFCCYLMAKRIRSALREWANLRRAWEDIERMEREVNREE
jgi:hypothetical protein